MAARRRRSPARWLAPVALVTCAVAVYAVVEQGTSHDSGATSKGGSQRTTTAAGTAPKPAASKSPTTYTVKAGDTLSAISVSTGVPLETIQRLNPRLDAQSLHAGQKVKLAP
jgi:LysM repeat protein